ncbi:unnamed protein product [Effrenium voratum]|nr:unnamed protein product [Effrenium voratum]
MGLLLVSIIYDVFFFKLRVLMAGGAQTGNWTKLLYRCVAWEVGCLKELHLRTTEEGRFVLDHSELYRSQRKALVDLLVEIMQQCLQLRGKFRIRNAETVLRIAFEHALRVRKGIIADDFQRHTLLDRSFS